MFFFQKVKIELFKEIHCNKFNICEFTTYKLFLFIFYSHFSLPQFLPTLFVLMNTDNNDNIKLIEKQSMAKHQKIENQITPIGMSGNI